MKSPTPNLLHAHLAMCVSLRVAELRGCDIGQEIERVRPFARDLGAHGDDLFYRGKYTAEMINKLVDAVAVLAHVPGGITLFGLHFEVKT